MRFRVTPTDKKRIDRIFNTRGSFSRIARALVMKYVTEHEIRKGLKPIGDDDEDDKECNI